MAQGIIPSLVVYLEKKFSPIVGDIVDFDVQNETEGYIQHVHKERML